MAASILIMTSPARLPERARVAIVFVQVGSEHFGVSAAAREGAVGLKIRMAPGVDSLNVALAAGVSGSLLSFFVPSSGEMAEQHARKSNTDAPATKCRIALQVSAFAIWNLSKVEKSSPSLRPPPKGVQMPVTPGRWHAEVMIGS